MRITTDHVRVKVPATAGNLGPGFDALGMALGVWDDVEVRAVASNGVSIEIEGEGADTLPRDESHLIVQAINAGLEHVGASHVGLEIKAVNSIPHGRGLGSSAAAVVAGLTAVRAMIADPNALDHTATLRLATAFEGHPDNAAPAIWGGATVAWQDESGAHASALEVSAALETVVLIPSSTLPTKEARAVLPPQVPHSHAAFNVGRAALLVHALEGHFDLLMAATEDKLHQSYRAGVMPPAVAMLQHLRGHGLAAVVSGAGPSVLVMGRDLATLAAGELEGIGGEKWALVHTAGRVPGASAAAV